MIPELGHFALILALVLSALTGISFALPNRWFPQSWVSRLTLCQSFFVIVSFLALWCAFVTDDFSVAYVAQQSSKALPWGYKATALWGAHEGSMLLWLLILALWGIILNSFTLEAQVKTTALRLYAWIFFGFALFILATSNPFLRFLPMSPVDGGELNPLLQDPAFIIHPPILYLGYVGLVAPFVLCLSMVAHNQWQPHIIRCLRVATLWSWSFLTLGITLGSWWAYYELGWGGWWFWDPVENASLMPWLVSCGLLHGLRILEVRHTGHNWVAFMAVLGFAMSLLGTFLVRSGVLTSVHAFSSDPSRGLFILIFWTGVVGGALGLLIIRAKDYALEVNLWSKEAMLFLQSLLMMVALGTVLLGTTYPIFIDAVWHEKLSVGPPYFNALMGPLFLITLVFLSIGPSLSWNKHTKPFSKKLLGLPLCLVFSVGLLSFVYHWTVYQAFALSLIGISLVVTLVTLRKFKLSALLQPMTFAHVGVLITAFGVLLSSALQEERDVALSEGQSVEVSGYVFTVDHFYDIDGPNYQGVASSMRVERNNQLIAHLHPQKRFYPARGMALSETAIEPNFLRDLYVALGEPLDHGWSFRVYVKPFVRWIWLGGIVMALAGFWSALRLRSQTFRVPKAQGVLYD